MPVANIYTVAVAVIISSFAISLPLPSVQNENSVVKNSVQKWPDATIPYEYSNNLCKYQIPLLFQSKYVNVIWKYDDINHLTVINIIISARTAICDWECHGSISQQYLHTFHSAD